jgi:ABC-2 type transport system ATP-binding protein
MTIEFASVSKRYGKHAALNGLCLSVPEGSAFALIGANGAGKTTAIKVLMNLIEPQSGTVSILGCDSRSLSPRELARIGYVSENQVLPKRMSVGAYLKYLRPFYPTWDVDRERELLEQVRLPMDRKISDLSHGMRVKVALVSALAFRPALLVLDEPFSGLDALMRDQLMEILVDRVGDTTVLISSHELAEIETFVTHVAFIENGKLLFQDPIEDLNGRLREIHVTLSRGPRRAIEPPPEWLQVRTTGNVISFVETAYDEATFDRRLRSLVPDVRDIEVRAVGLRQIFTTLARAAQSERPAT